jgi:hypothetical protein
METGDPACRAVLQPPHSLVHHLSSLSLLSFSSLSTNFKASLHQLFPLFLVHEFHNCLAFMDPKSHLETENGVVDVVADVRRHKFRQFWMRIRRAVLVLPR